MMTLNELIKTQYDFDSAHGWNVDPKDVKALIESLSNDLIGVIAETGEFANILKKILLETKRISTAELETLYSDRYSQLCEELVDAFIYIIRISASMNIDLESEYIKKLDFNATRYKSYEISK